ncbi:arsenite methyltransferase [Poriferisphaera sp. WC338]|uniref:arsenite methyltransferase n=1 Tax=Poriferisphaera sp. WC338 TaxID=3425129 RepID=UPI003D818041
MTAQQQSEDQIRDTVRDGYKKVALHGSLDVISDNSSSCCSPSNESEPTSGGCCGGTSQFSADKLAEQIGYTADEVAALPEGANMGLSCGNPTAIANLTEGQTVLDLGSGGGFDIFLAGPKVGATGKAIGVDMTAEMITKARNNIASYTKSTGLANVEFRLGEIEHLPVADNSVDVVISNCVINLSPNKPQVWAEIARVLKPGGKVAASDVVLLKTLPEPVREQAEALVGCVAGAVLLDDYESMMKAVGLSNITLNAKANYVESLRAFKAPIYDAVQAQLPDGLTPNDYITSADIIAIKP